MIEFKQKGDFKNVEKLLSRMTKANFRSILERAGQEGVDALSKNTPVDSGRTASSWSYEVRQNRSGLSIIWKNSNVVSGVPIAIILQYGHGTKNGGFVQGRDYINPALKPIFDRIAENVRREVSK